MALCCDICFLPVSSTRCEGCGVEVESSAAASRRPRCPAGFTVTERAGLLRISWGWRQPESGALLAFAGAWDGFLSIWYSNWLSSESPPMLMGALPLLHLCAGGWLSWFALWQFFNRTVVEITPYGVSVRHGPVPGRRGVFVRGLTAVYAENGRVIGERLDGASVVLCERLAVSEATFVAEAIRARAEVGPATAFDRRSPAASHPGTAR